MDEKLAEALQTGEWPQIRYALALEVAAALRKAGNHLSLAGHVFGEDNTRDKPSGGNGSSEAVAIATLLRSSASVVFAILASVNANECYAASVLMRQLLETEYLVYCFAKRIRAAADWFEASDDERRTAWQPRHLRRAANGHFEQGHYDWHCRIGGHPTPYANNVLNCGQKIRQALVCDTLIHSRNLWNLLVEWSENEAKVYDIWRISFQGSKDLAGRLEVWHTEDPAGWVTFQ